MRFHIFTLLTVVLAAIALPTLALPLPKGGGGIGSSSSGFRGGSSGSKSGGYSSYRPSSSSYKPSSSKYKPTSGGSKDSKTSKTGLLTAGAAGVGLGVLGNGACHHHNDGTQYTSTRCPYRYVQYSSGAEERKSAEEGTVVMVCVGAVSVVRLLW